MLPHIISVIEKDQNLQTNCDTQTEIAGDQDQP